jgi:hypothetical protein
MNIAQLKNIAGMTGIKSEKMNQALSLAKQMGLVNNGEIEGSAEQFRNIVNQNGGIETLNRGLKKLENPLIKNALKLCGINVDEAKKAALKAMGSGNIAQAESGLLERINKLN